MHISLILIALFILSKLYFRLMTNEDIMKLLTSPWRVWLFILIVTLKIFQLYRHYQTYWGRKVQTDNITDWPLNPLTLD